MKAAQLVQYGGKDAVIVQAAPEPGLGADQVLVEVAAAGVNPFDILVREGGARHMAELKFPATLGGDFAGTITQVGADVKDLQVGQAVYGQAKALSGHGSFAELVPVPASQLAPKPAKLDFIQAGAVPLASVSAYQALADHIGLQAGQKLLVHGGAGGIGSMAIQLAKHLGAYVAATAGTKDLEFVKSLGADEVIDYQQQDFLQIINGYDAVFDTVGGEVTIKSYQVLRKGGKLVSMAAKPDEALAKQSGIEFVSQATRVTTQRLTQLADLFDQGAIKPQIDKVFPLDQAAEALDYLQTKRPRGKVVIQVK